MPKFLPNLWLVAKGSWLIDGEVMGERGLLEWIDSRCPLGWVGGTLDGDDVVTALQQRFEHAFPECLLPMDNDAHVVTP